MCTKPGIIKKNQSFSAVQNGVNKKKNIKETSNHTSVEPPMELPWLISSHSDYCVSRKGALRQKRQISTLLEMGDYIFRSDTEEVDSTTDSEIILR